VFSKTFLSFEKALFSGSESEGDQSLNRVQSLSLQRIRIREQEKEEDTNNLYRFLPQFGSSPVPLALPRRVPLKCNIKLQVAQTHK